MAGRAGHNERAASRKVYAFKHISERSFEIYFISIFLNLNVNTFAFARKALAPVEALSTS